MDRRPPRCGGIVLPPDVGRGRTHLPLPFQGTVTKQLARPPSPSVCAHHIMGQPIHLNQPEALPPRLTSESIYRMRQKQNSNKKQIANEEEHKTQKHKTRSRCFLAQPARTQYPKPFSKSLFSTGPSLPIKGRPWRLWRCTLQGTSPSLECRMDRCIRAWRGEWCNPLRDWTSTALKIGT